MNPGTFQSHNRISKMMVTPDHLIEPLNHMALRVAAMLTTLHFPSHFLFHVSMSTISAKISACPSGTSLTTQAQLHQNRAPLPPSQHSPTQSIFISAEGHTAVNACCAKMMVPLNTNHHIHGQNCNNHLNQPKSSFSCTSTVHQAVVLVSAYLITRLFTYYWPSCICYMIS